MATLIIQEWHLWLNLAKIWDADNVCFLNAPILEAGLIGDFFQDSEADGNHQTHLAPVCNHPSLIDKRGILLWCLHLLWCSLILHLSCNVKPPAGMSPSLSPRQPSKRTVKQSWHRPPRDGGEWSCPGGAGNTTPYPVGWRSDNLLLPLFSVLPKLLMKELFPQFLSHICHSRAVSKEMFPHSQPGYALLVHLDKVLGPDATTPLWRIRPVWWKDLLS